MLAMLEDVSCVSNLLWVDAIELVHRSGEHARLGGAHVAEGRPLQAGCGVERIDRMPLVPRTTWTLQLASGEQG